MTLSLFPDEARQYLSDGACVLRGCALAQADALIVDIQRVLQEAPLRHMLTASGHRMAVAMSNCGSLGWVSDRRGYRYATMDPLSQHAWPAMPATFMALAQQAAGEAGYADFRPDACLINRYAVGTRLSLHQDKDEHDFSQPIVSVSLGVPAVFLFGGARRPDRPARVRLEHGDVVVWGGPSRLNFHGVAELAGDTHQATGPYRFNLTFRKAA